ncbi:hypothetical protein Tco_0126036, partial [Tanacetum coccineum]
ARIRRIFLDGYGVSAYWSSE